MKKFTKDFSCVRKVLLSCVLASLAMGGYAQYELKLYPVADMQFRKDNTAQSGTGPSLEIRTATAGSIDNAFVGGLKFNLTGLIGEGEIVTGATLRLTAPQASKQIKIYPFSVDWGETGGTTDSWAAKETYIQAAAASTPVVADFSLNWPAAKKIFEWTDFTISIADYQKTVDVTSYIQSKIASSEYEIGMLLAPVSTAIGDASMIFTKDASETTYGTSTTNGYNDDGTGPTGSGNVTRWSRIEQLLRISGNKPVSELYPLLTLTINDTSSAIDVATADKAAVIDNVYYDLAGRQVSKAAAKGILLQKSVYEDGSISYGKVYVK